MAEWDTYSSGGVKADDARLYRKKMEQDARLSENECNFSPPLKPPPRAQSTSARLIEVSPERPPPVLVSRNAGLLIDLDVEPDTPPLEQSKSLSYANAALSSKSKGKGKVVDHLLD